MRDPDSTPQAQATPPWAVIDTNVVLDLLLFDDPRSRWLMAALSAQQLVWVGTAPMLAELADVLTRPFAAGRGTAAAVVLAQAHTMCRLLAEPASMPERPPRCADPDDQKFIDLAWTTPTAWLFSRDRALLNLARPARLRGVRVCTPSDGMPRP